MRIRCWGARGSIPVSGPGFQKYGGDTTCMEVRTSRNDEILIVDAGSGIRRLANSLLAESRYEYTFLFTHAHWDHILGFPFFKPIYSDRTILNIHGCPLQQGDMRTLLSRTMDAPHFPVPFDQVKAAINYADVCFTALELDGMTVDTIPLSHPNMGVGYKFVEDGKSFVFLTDNELMHPHRGRVPFEKYVEYCRDAELLVHDAEYTDAEYDKRTGWGHSTCEQALELAITAGVRRFGLFHHNQDRDDRGVDRMVGRCRDLIKERGVDMQCFGVTQDMIIVL